MTSTEDTRFVNPHSAFMRCFKTDEQRKNYMYMYSIEDIHYFKNIDTRMYVHVERKGL